MDTEPESAHLSSLEVVLEELEPNLGDRTVESKQIQSNSARQLKVLWSQLFETRSSSASTLSAKSPINEHRRKSSHDKADPIEVGVADVENGHPASQLKEPERGVRENMRLRHLE